MRMTLVQSEPVSVSFGLGDCWGKSPEAEVLVQVGVVPRHRTAPRYLYRRVRLRGRLS